MALYEKGIEISTRWDLEREIVDLKDKLRRRNMQIKELKKKTEAVRSWLEHDEFGYEDLAKAKEILKGILNV